MQKILLKEFNKNAIDFDKNKFTYDGKPFIIEFPFVDVFPNEYKGTIYLSIFDKKVIKKCKVFDKLIDAKNKIIKKYETKDGESKEVLTVKPSKELTEKFDNKHIYKLMCEPFYSSAHKTLTMTVIKVLPKEKPSIKEKYADFTFDEN